MRDLSLLQVQMRDLPGYKDTRHQLLTIRPQQRASWIGYAISLHLNKQYGAACKILTQYEKQQNVPGDLVPDYETGELVLYKAHIMIDDGKLEVCGSTRACPYHNSVWWYC